MPHSIYIRMYYEDTDHGHVVYYANYLKYMERGRTELLRHQGIDLQQLEEYENIMFAVTHANIHYIASAKFNDLIEVQTNIEQLQGARISFMHTIWRVHSETKKRLTQLNTAEIRLACLNTSGKVQRIPHTIINKLKDESHD